MNAIKFIQQHGVDKAREVVDGAPRNAVYYWQIPRCKYGVYSSHEQKQGRAIVLEELKRLVESVDITTKVGGIREAIEEHTKWMHAPELHLYRIGESVERLKQAIADYEAIYSNDCEILDYPEDYTSPNCKKYDERVK